MVRYFLAPIFFLTCFAVGGGLHFLYFSYKSAPLKATKANILWIEGKQAETSSAVQHLSSNQQRLYLLCLRGFFLQQQKKFIESDKIFAKIYDQRNKASFLFQEELIGGKIFNAFFLDNADELSALVSTYLQECPDSLYAPFFQFLLAYKEKRFLEAMEYLASWEGKGKIQERIDWLNSSIESLFSQIFLGTIKAHCLIETEKFTEGRCILNEIIERMLKKEWEWNTRNYDTALLLLSRSYFLELKRSTTTSIYSDYYEMLYFYQKKIHSIDQRAYEQFLPQHELIPTLIAHAFILPTEQLAPLINLIKNWDKFYTHPDNTLLIQPLLQHCFVSPKQVGHICHILMQAGLDNIAKKIIDAFANLLSEKVKQIAIKDAQVCLSILKRLQPNMLFTEQLTVSQDTLISIVSHDDKRHTQLRNYLKLWEEIQSYDIDRQQLVQQLIEGAKSLWHEGNYDDKALSLLHVILQFTNYDIESANSVFLFIKQVYKQALSIHAIDRLLKLEEFISDSALTPIWISEEEIANFLADAEYLYEHGEYKKCYLYSLWLTKVAPSSLTYRLLGLCLLENKHYLEAWKCLHTASLTCCAGDTKIQKALTLCQKHLSKEMRYYKR
ncbi:hypothetical protein CP10139811_0692 [Chlamydia ibidis]|uniref:Tetratricopeptide repeat family protein n=2 Tax=Chlamydia ibidis TaxID=1405396 RepID=S7KEI2_9CHLA|nr:DUF1347 family protein [Chlamydia ibidis]EPP34606.1 hypothetical protein CP10139811_0692 [Chlamydia ibidis]EQM63197.1 hypothetical protein H359_0011 [Chlamydia ibidis 10-1398/6]